MSESQENVDATTTSPEAEEVFETSSGDGAVADAVAGVGPEASGEPEDAVAVVESSSEVIDAEVEEPVDQAAEYLALAQRTKADFDNYRKRAARDAAAAQERGTAKLARELLPALDNLERAISHAAEEDPLLAGIRLVQTDLLAALTRAGIASFDPAGEKFDPTLHEAVAQLPAEGAEPGTVLETYQQGYRLGDAVLRPARVLVAQ